MATSFLLALGLFVAQRSGAVLPTHMNLLGTVAATTAVWLIVAFTTQETDPETLKEFYRLARPSGPGWARMRAECGGLASPDDVSTAFAGWWSGLALVYGALFGTGLALLGRPLAGGVALAVGAAGGVMLMRVFPRLWRAAPAGHVLPP